MLPGARQTLVASGADGIALLREVGIINLFCCNHPLASSRSARRRDAASHLRTERARSGESFFWGASKLFFSSLNALPSTLLPSGLSSFSCQRPSRAHHAHCTVPWRAKRALSVELRDVGLIIQSSVALLLKLDVPLQPCDRDLMHE